MARGIYDNGENVRLLGPRLTESLLASPSALGQIAAAAGLYQATPQTVRDAARTSAPKTVGYLKSALQKNRAIIDKVAKGLTPQKVTKLLMRMGASASNARLLPLLAVRDALATRLMQSVVGKEPAKARTDLSKRLKTKRWQKFRRELQRSNPGLAAALEEQLKQYETE